MALFCFEPLAEAAAAELVHTFLCKPIETRENPWPLTFHLEVPLRDALVATAMQQRQLKPRILVNIFLFVYLS